MKKFIIASVFLLIASISFAGPIVTVSFQIGRKSLGCDKFGICDPRISVSWKLSTMQVDETTNSLLVNISSEMIAGKEEYFAGQSVTFDEAVVLPLDVQQALGSATTITIQTGTYKLVKTRTGYTITIPLSNSSLR